jgi:polyhydroxybutyrate depolymerase
MKAGSSMRAGLAALLAAALAVLPASGCGQSSNRVAGDGGDGPGRDIVDTGREADLTADNEAADGDGDAPGGDAEDAAVEDAPEGDAGDAEDAPHEHDVPADCPVPDDLGPGEHTVTLEFDGRERRYIAYVPESYDAAAPTPLVMNIHGYTSADWQQVLFSNMNPTADAHGFIVIYPNGFRNSWNAGSCCGTAADMNLDDVGFLVQVVEDSAGRLCIDRRRVYATGMSNGGYMSHRLACEASDVFAAAAPVAGALGVDDCSPPRPVPVMAFHGTEDPLVSYGDGEAAFLHWVASNGCSGPSERTVFGGSFCDTYSSCEGGAEAALCTLDPMGHCWPGGSESLCLALIGPYNDDINANEHMWEFFRRFTLPP